MKTPKQLERYFKGLANHRRLEILLLDSENEGITLEEIAKRLNCNFKTIPEHTRRLLQAGLLRKDYQGKAVCHSLSPYERMSLEFISKIE